MNNRRRLYAPTTLALLCALAAVFTMAARPARAGWSTFLAAGALVTLDFESIPGMNNAVGHGIPSQSRLADQFGQTAGVRFSSSPGYVAVVNLGAGHAVSGVNGIGGATAGGTLTYEPGDPIEARFVRPGNPFQAATTSMVSIRGDLRPTARSPLSMFAFDVSGNPIAHVTVPEADGLTLRIEKPGIHSVRVVGNGSTAFDDFTFRATAPTLTVQAAAQIAPSILRHNGWGLDPRRSHGERGAVMVPVTITAPANEDLRVFVRATSHTAGHAHDGDRPHGWLLKSPRRELPKLIRGFRPGTLAYSTFEGGLRINSGSSGEVVLYYVAPEFSGEEVITVATEEANASQRTTATHHFSVKIPALVSLRSEPQEGVTLTGSTPEHPEVWSLEGAAAAALREAAATYRASQESDAGANGLPQLIARLAAYGYDFPLNADFDENPAGLHLPQAPEEIIVEDVSLSEGGLLDLDGRWTANQGHLGHRLGTHLDVRSRHLYVVPGPQRVRGSGPYRLVGRSAPRQRVAPPAEGYRLAVGDDRLTAPRGLAPFRDTDVRRDAEGNPVTGPEGQPLHYDAAARREMNELVKKVHFRRLELLIDALWNPAPGVRGVFATEGNHIHVQYD